MTTSRVCQCVHEPDPYGEWWQHAPGCDFYRPPEDEDEAVDRALRRFDGTDR